MKDRPSFKTWFMRDCQPFPLALYPCNTSGSRRKETSSFLFSSLGRPRNFSVPALCAASSSGSVSAIGRSLLSSFSDGYHVSVSLLRFFGVFFIQSPFSRVRFAQADHAAYFPTLYIKRRMQSAVDGHIGKQAGLSIILPLIHQRPGLFPLRGFDSLKQNAMLFEVFRIFLLIPLVAHRIKVLHLFGVSKNKSTTKNKTGKA